VEDRRWHQRRDGTRFFANGTMRSIRDKSGDLIGFVKVCRDDTARLLGEEERAHLAEQRRLALDAARLGWWQMDLATGWGVVDEGFARIFGVPSGPIDVEASKALLHPDDRDRVAAAVEATLRPENAQPYEIEYRIRRPDGPVRWIAATGRVIYGDGAGPPRPVSFVGTVADITEAKAAAMALAASEASFRELADAMPQIVFAATPDGHVDYFNRQWYDYTGLPEGAIGFEHWQHVHKPDMLPEVTRVWQVALAAGSTYELEYPLRRHDGQFRWHLGRARPVKDDSGRVVRWFGTNTDIHDQKRLREEAEAARRHAEEAGRLKDEFLATVSHELRTPLSAIVGWSHLLEGGRSDPATLNEGLSVIHRNAQAQSQLIEDILDVSRITTGKLRLHSRPVGLREPIEAAIATVRTAADAKGVAVALDLDGNTRLLGDPDRLQQIFWNLLANAIKFTPPGGRVAVRQWREETRAVVTVADTGRGIGPEFLPYVFDRFRQADMTTTRRHGGLGLGLSIVRHLVDLHGGHVSVTSDGDGHGSTFRVDLPLHAAVPSDAETPASDQAGPNGSTSTPLKGRRVLVLEDEVDTRRVLEAALTRDGAAVASASSVQDAMDLLAREDSFDAVVSDIGLPDEDGYAFVRRLRAGEAERGSPRLPAIALTAYTRTSDRSAVLAAGFDLFLPKPVSPSELRVALLELLG
ncbi:MAG TPA: PAS domain-containing protein, partial [Tepidisphaeraceae bacterium]